MDEIRRRLAAAGLPNGLDLAPPAASAPSPSALAAPSALAVPGMSGGTLHPPPRRLTRPRTRGHIRQRRSRQRSRPPDLSGSVPPPRAGSSDPYTIPGLENYDAGLAAQNVDAGYRGRLVAWTKSI